MAFKNVTQLFFSFAFSLSFVSSCGFSSHSQDLAGSEDLSRTTPRNPGFDEDQVLRFSCVGTEPFWSLGLDDSQRNLVFATPGGNERNLRIVQSGAMLGRQIAFAQGVILSEGQRTATLSILGESCSDGMSDFTYSHTGVLFIDNRFFHGCCGRRSE